MNLTTSVDPMGGSPGGRRSYVRLRRFSALGLSGSAVFVLGACLAAATPAQSASKPLLHKNGALASTRDAIIDCTNRERAQRGLGPLRRSRTLRRAAQFHAGNMLRQGFFAHNDKAGRTPAERVMMFQKRNKFHFIGENIAAGYGSGRSACRSWIESSKHRHNMLDPEYKWIGVGYASGSAGYGTYFVQNFGG
jgi:uncharacterized protein YkwD